MANKKFWLGMLATALAFGLILSGCDDDSGGDTPDNPSLALGKPSWTAETPNKDNVNEMLDRLWSDAAASEVQGITQGQVFSWSGTTLTVYLANVTDGLKTWVTTQWGGTDVPVKAAVTGGTPAGTPDANWDGAHLVWINLATAADNASAFVGLTDGSSIGYTVDVIPVLALGKPSWTAETPNKDNVNEMLDRLWSDAAASEVQGITQGQVFSWSGTTLTVYSANVTDGLKTWVTTQWGGTDVPVKAAVTGAVPAGTADANWGGAYLVWINLATAADNASASVGLTDGSSIGYTVDVQ